MREGKSEVSMKLLVIYKNWWNIVQSRNIRQRKVPQRPHWPLQDLNTGYSIVAFYSRQFMLGPPAPGSAHKSDAPL